MDTFVTQVAIWIPILITAASIIVKATPTPKDNEILEKIMVVLRIVAINARTKDNPLT